VRDDMRARHHARRSTPTWCVITCERTKEHC
jgi:hypothetical protein